MRILMLGWEFPPFIAGGLGVACYGLTRALDRLGHEIIFVLPRPIDRGVSTHVHMLAPEPGARMPRAGAMPEVAAREAFGMPGFERTVFHAVPAAFHNPYPGTGPVGAPGGLEGAPGPVRGGPAGPDAPPVAGATTDPGAPDDAGETFEAPNAGATYGTDLIGDSQRYARLVLALASGLDFDVVHAHDWLAYPAGIAIARAKGVPLVAQVHATEFDRSGEHVNQPVYDIERRGMHAANRVIAVSMLTKSICAHRYGVPPERIDVVYNGIEEEEVQPQGEGVIRSRDKIVLFLGRLTMQKGPEFFISAASRVLEKISDVKFVVAGSGDMARAMIEQAASLGIGQKVLFTGFLHRRDVERVFRMADCYVMPSVSEPFGLVALEAIQNDVPAIISKQSGASEVLTHVLKVDFWDVDEMANKIVAVLKHPPLSQTLREHGPFELRRLTWEGAARRCEQVYHGAGVR
jgi:glycosyltransferase involved in cell wall biosynthesis